MSDAVIHRDVEFDADDAALDVEQDFVLPPKGGLSRLAMAFAVGLLAAATFTGGVLLQKNHDKGLTSSSTSGLPAGLGTASGFPAGFAGGATSGTGTAAAAGAGTGTGASSSTGLAVIGSVVSVTGTDVTVKDLGGKTHDVHTTTTTTVTRSQTQTLSSLAAGTQVTVTGSTATDGTVTATAITAH